MPSASHSVYLTDEDERFVGEQIASGRYPDVNAVVRDALRLKREQEENQALDEELTEVNSAADQAEARGAYVDLPTPEDLRAFLATLGRGPA
jgi:putative addiction module CopG family antidote